MPFNGLCVITSCYDLIGRQGLCVITSCYDLKGRQLKGRHLKGRQLKGRQPQESRIVCIAFSRVDGVLMVTESRKF